MFWNDFAGCVNKNMARVLFQTDGQRDSSELDLSSLCVGATLAKYVHVACPYGNHCKSQQDHDFGIGKNVSLLIQTLFHVETVECCAQRRTKVVLFSPKPWLVWIMPNS